MRTDLLPRIDIARRKSD